MLQRVRKRSYSLGGRVRRERRIGVGGSRERWLLLTVALDKEELIGESFLRINVEKLRMIKVFRRVNELLRIVTWLIRRVLSVI